MIFWFETYHLHQIPESLICKGFRDFHTLAAVLRTVTIIVKSRNRHSAK